MLIVNLAKRFEILFYFCLFTFHCNLLNAIEFFAMGTNLNHLKCVTVDRVFQSIFMRANGLRLSFIVKQIA